jgi:hypothetical protein
MWHHEISYADFTSKDYKFLTRPFFVKKPTIQKWRAVEF